jgi:hypothetical protein
MMYFNHSGVTTEQMNQNMTKLATHMGHTWNLANVLAFNISANIAYTNHKVNGQPQRKHVLSVHYVINRKLPCPKTIFPDSFGGCDRVGRRLCNICSYWGKVDDTAVNCSKCRCYLLPLDQDMADLAIQSLKPETPQWDPSVPFDPTSQIGGTITLTQKLRFGQAVGILCLTNNASQSMILRNTKYQQNQIRSVVGVKLGTSPLLDGRMCENLRGIIGSIDPVLSDFFDTLGDFSHSALNKKTVGVQCQFSTDGLELNMTFRLYLPPGHLTFSGRPTGMNEGQQTWACDRGIMMAFLSADLSQSISSLRLLPYAGKAIPKPVKETKPAKAKAKALEDEAEPASPAHGAASGASFSTLVSPAVTAAAVEGTVDEFTTPAGLPSTSSCSASSATSCETSSSSSSKATPMELEGVSQVDTPLKDDEDSLAPAPAFQELRCSAGDNRMPGGYDVLDTSLSGLLKSMMVDGMKMNCQFPGFTREFLCSTAHYYSERTERFSKAHSSISGLMQV